MKHHAYVFFLLVLIFPTLLYPQNIDVDSLLKVLSQKNHDTIKISASLDLAWYYMYTKTDSAIFYAEKALNLSQANNYKENISASYIALGICYNTKTEYSKALSYLNKSLKIENELLSKNPDFSSYKRGLLVTNLDIGNIYFFQGNYAQAIEHYFQTLKLAEEIDFKKAICLSSGNIGLCYKDLKDYTKALEYNYKALGVAIETGNKSDLHQCYNNLGDIYFVMSELDSAKMYFTNCLNINKEDNNEPNLVKTYVNLANVYTKEKKYDKALRYYKLSLELSEKLDLKDGQINVNFMMGKYFSLLKNYKSAINHFTKSLELAKEIGNLQFVMQTNNELSLLYQNIGDYKKALQYYIDKSITEDSIFTLKSNEKIAGIEARYEIEQKDNEIAKQKLQIEKESKRRNYLIFGSIALLLLVILIYQWIANRQKRKNKETELALKLKKAESKNLKELNNAKSRFFANITHEFRTPLTLIMGPLQDVIGKIKGEDKEILKIAHSNSKKLLTLVNDILDLSTVEEGSPELNKSETCILSFLKRIFYSYESYAKIRQIGTEIVIAEGNDVLVNIDLAKLEKIINNLLSNAFKYTESGGSVKLLVDMKKDTVFITVKDTGVGIDEKDIKYIFERYYQGLNSENITGTGIGLSFANRLAKMMGGKISVESKRKEGSIFTLQLPIVIIKECIEDLGALQGGINIEEKADYKVKAIFADKPRILIVEDNYEMQKYLSGILKEYFHIDLAENGFEGLKKLKENKYDLVSSDVMMPGMDGFVFRQEMNKNLERRNIPFILLTARSLKEDKIRGFKLGVDDYITKPFNATEYIARINNLIKNKQERDKWINDKMEDINLPSEKNNDSDMIKELEKIIIKNIDNPDFKVTKLAIMSNCSPRNLSRMTKKLIGLTPVKLILEVRLQKAYQLLKSNKYKTVSEVRYEVGIDNASYFTRKFVERFGVKPGELGLAS